MNFYSRPIALCTWILSLGALSSPPALADNPARYTTQPYFSSHRPGSVENIGSPGSCTAVSESSRRAQARCAALQGVGGAYDAKFRVPGTNTLENEIALQQSQAKKAQSQNRHSDYVSSLQRTVDLASGAAESAQGFIAQANQAYANDTSRCPGCRDMCDEIRDELTSAFTRCERAQRELLSDLQTELTAARGGASETTVTSTTDTSKSLLTGNDTPATPSEAVATPSFFDIPTSQSAATGSGQAGSGLSSQAQALVETEVAKPTGSLTPVSASASSMMAMPNRPTAPANAPDRSGIDFSSLATKFNSSDESAAADHNSGSSRAPAGASAADKKAAKDDVTYDFSKMATAFSSATPGPRKYDDAPEAPQNTNYIRGKRKATKAERAAMEASAIRDLEEAKTQSRTKSK